MIIKNRINEFIMCTVQWDCNVVSDWKSSQGKFL
jgi:hypothetical protein